MNDCHFCKDELTNANEFKITSPDGKELCLCSSCMADVTTFFKTGRAELVMLKQKSFEHKPKLVLERLAVSSRLGYEFGLVEKFDDLKRVFSNVKIQEVNFAYLHPDTDRLLSKYDVDSALINGNSRALRNFGMDSYYETKKVMEFRGYIE